MSVSIPWTRIRDVSIRAQLFSGDQEGTLGGPSLHIPRIGDRFAIDVETTQFKQDAESRTFMAALFEASTGGAIVRLRQPNRSGVATYSLPVIDGDGQAGSVL